MVLSTQKSQMAVLMFSFVIITYSHRTPPLHRRLLRPRPQERDVYRVGFWTVLQRRDLEVRPDRVRPPFPLLLIFFSHALVTDSLTLTLTQRRLFPRYLLGGPVPRPHHLHDRRKLRLRIRLRAVRRQVGRLLQPGRGQVRHRRRLLWAGELPVGELHHNHHNHDNHDKHDNLQRGQY